MQGVQRENEEFNKERGWDDLRPSDLAKSVSIEAAELLELFQWSNETAAEVKANPELMEKVKKELADVLIYCLSLASQVGVEAGDIIRAKMQHNREKYPAEVVRAWSSTRRDKGTEEEYLKIKAEWRKKDNA